MLETDVNVLWSECRAQSEGFICASTQKIKEISMKQFLRCGWFTGVICLLGFGLSVRPALAADPAAVGVEVGVDLNKPSLDIPNVSGGSTMKAGVLAGISVQQPLRGMAAIQWEFAYAQKNFGVDIKDTGSSGGSFKANETVDVFEIPILLRLNLHHPAKGLGYYVIVGPAVSFRMRTHESDAFNNGVASTADPNLKSELKRIDASIIGGGGITKGKWDIEARYDAGLRDLNQDNKLGVGTTVKSRTTSINFRWRFK